jgi:hypothetical protein
MAGIASLIIYALAGETAVHLGSVYNISFQGDRTFGVTMSPDAVLIFVVLTAMLTLLISLGHLAAQRCRTNGG